MNTISSLFKWIGNTVGANPSTMATTSKTVVGAINELSQQISDVDSSVEKRTLLWTNGNPTATFSTQTISLSLSDYDSVEVVYKLHQGQQVNLTPQRAYKGEKTITVAASGVSGYFLGAFASIAREMQMSATGVIFGSASIVLGTGSWATDDRGLIPYKIYGIK